MPKAPDTSTKIETFRPPEAEEYMPEKGSALHNVDAQGRGTTIDERDQNDVRKHTHNGTNSKPINVRDLVGFIRTVGAAPTWTPVNVYEQFAVYESGGTKRLYIYDTLNKAWRFVALT